MFSQSKLHCPFREKGSRCTNNLQVSNSSHDSDVGKTMRDEHLQPLSEQAGAISFPSQLILFLLLLIFLARFAPYGIRREQFGILPDESIPI